MIKPVTTKYATKNEFIPTIRANVDKGHT